jgi:hypothetical protein
MRGLRNPIRMPAMHRVGNTAIIDMGSITIACLRTAANMRTISTPT